MEALFFLVSKDSGKLLYALSILKWLFIINEIYGLCDCTCTLSIVHSITFYTLPKCLLFHEIFGVIIMCHTNPTVTHELFDI